MMKNEGFVGREREYRALEKCYLEKHSQLVIVTGRRRVGKTFLVNRAFDGEFVFKLTGSKDQTNKEQLRNFADELSLRRGTRVAVPVDWQAAFLELRVYLESLPKDKRLVVFIDEMPWLDKPKSRFLPCFEYFWNHYGSAKNNLMFVIAGSSSSWIQKKIIKNKGGLFDRQSAVITLYPFTLLETERFLTEKGFLWSRPDIVRLYMATGGVPFYLELLDPTLSFNQNVDSLFFKKGGPLSKEFERLFETLFSRKEGHLSVVSALGKVRYGLTRKELAESTGLAYNGALSEILESLEECGFVSVYRRYGDRKEVCYYLSDFFSQFYLRFVRGKTGIDEHFWSNSAQSPARRAYEGIAFEFICLGHLSQIRESLSIGGVLSESFCWKISEDGTYPGAQVDLIISRKDNTETLCEMKFTEGLFAIDKNYEAVLRNKITRYMDFTKRRKSLQLVLITTFGLSRNIYSNIVSKTLVLDDLFR